MKTWTSASAWNSLIAKMNDNELLTYPVCCSFVKVTLWHCLYATFYENVKTPHHMWISQLLLPNVNIKNVIVNWIDWLQLIFFTQKWKFPNMKSTFSHVNYKHPYANWLAFILCFSALRTVQSTLQPATFTLSHAHSYTDGRGADLLIRTNPVLPNQTPPSIFL